MTTRSTKKEKKKKAPRTVRARVSVAQQVKTPTEQSRFLKHFIAVGNIAGACRLSKIGRRTIYNWLEHDAAFQERYADAQETAADTLEQEARRRGLRGVREPVYQGGQLVGYIQKYSDTLLIFLLKGRRPDVFRERFEHSGPKGGPIPIDVTDARESLRKKLERLSARSKNAPKS